MRTASLPKKIFWGTKRTSVSVYLLMKIRCTTANIREASAFWIARFGALVLFVIAFRFIYRHQSSKAIHQRFAHSSMCLAWVNIKVSQLFFNFRHNLLLKLSVKWSTIMSEIISIAGLEREMEESLLCRECYPSCSNNEYRLTASSLPLVVNKRAGFGIT